MATRVRPFESSTLSLPEELLALILNKAFPQLANGSDVWRKGWKDLLSSPSGTKTGVAVVCGKGGANIEIYTAEGVFVRSVAVGCSNGTPINLKQKPCVWGNRWPSAVTSSADLVFISDYACNNTQVYGTSDMQYRKRASPQQLDRPEGVCLHRGFLYVLHLNLQNKRAVCTEFDPLNKKASKSSRVRAEFPKHLQAWSLCAGPDGHLYATVSKHMVGEFTEAATLVHGAVFRIRITVTAQGRALEDPVHFAGPPPKDLLSDPEATGDPNRLLGCKGLAFGPDGNLYVASASGAVLAFQGPGHSHPGESMGVCVSTDGTIPWGITFGPSRTNLVRGNPVGPGLTEVRPVGVNPVRSSPEEIIPLEISRAESSPVASNQAGTDQVRSGQFDMTPDETSPFPAELPVFTNPGSAGFPSETLETARELLGRWAPDALDEARGVFLMVDGSLPDEAGRDAGSLSEWYRTHLERLAASEERKHGESPAEAPGDESPESVTRAEVAAAKRKRNEFQTDAPAEKSPETVRRTGAAFGRRCVSDSGDGRTSEGMTSHEDDRADGVRFSGEATGKESGERGTIKGSRKEGDGSEKAILEEMADVRFEGSAHGASEEGATFPEGSGSALSRSEVRKGVRTEAELYVCTFDEARKDEGSLWIFNCAWEGGGCVRKEQRTPVPLGHGEPNGVACVPYKAAQ